MKWKVEISTLNQLAVIFEDIKLIMSKQIVFILIGFLTFNSCKQNQINVDWFFGNGGTFEQGKNQIIISTKGDTIIGFTSPNRMVELDGFYFSKYELPSNRFENFVIKQAEQCLTLLLKEPTEKKYIISG